MITIQEIYQGLIGLKKKNGLYQIFRINCRNGEIEKYKSGLSDEDVEKIMDAEGMERIPYHLLVEEAKRLHRYLNHK